MAFAYLAAPGVGGPPPTTPNELQALHARLERLEQLLEHLTSKTGPEGLPQLSSHLSSHLLLLRSPWVCVLLIGIALLLLYLICAPRPPPYYPPPWLMPGWRGPGGGQ